MKKPRRSGAKFHARGLPLRGTANPPRQYHSWLRSAAAQKKPRQGAGLVALSRACPERRQTHRHTYHSRLYSTRETRGSYKSEARLSDLCIIGCAAQEPHRFQAVSSAL